MRRIPMLATLLAIATVSVSLTACDEPPAPQDEIVVPDETAPDAENPADECPRADGQPCS